MTILHKRFPDFRYDYVDSCFGNWPTFCTCGTLLATVATLPYPKYPSNRTALRLIPLTISIACAALLSKITLQSVAKYLFNIETETDIRLTTNLDQIGIRFSILGAAVSFWPILLVIEMFLATIAKFHYPEHSSKITAHQLAPYMIAGASLLTIVTHHKIKNNDTSDNIHATFGAFQLKGLFMCTIASQCVIVKARRWFFGY